MADGVLTYLSSTEPNYSAPPGDALYFGGSFGGNLVFTAKSLPIYEAPVGNAIVFGVPGLPDAVDGAIATVLLDLDGGAEATLVYAGHANGEFLVSGVAASSGVFLGSMSGNLTLSGSVKATLAKCLVVVGGLYETGRAHAVLAEQLSVDADLVLLGQAYYAPSWYIPRPFLNEFGSSWGKQDPFDVALHAAHVQATKCDTASEYPWGTPQRVENDYRGLWGQIPAVTQHKSSRWGDLTEHPQVDVAGDYSSPEPKQREALRLPWGDLESIGLTIASDYASPPRQERPWALPWDSFDHLQRDMSFDYSHPAVKDVLKPIISGPYWYPRWCVRRYVTPNGNALVFNFPAPAYALPPGNALVFDYASSNDDLICYDGTWNGLKNAYWYQPHDWDIPQPAIRSYYIIMNTVSLKRVSDNAAIPIMGLEISTDLDSWCWSMTATLRREVDLDMVRPTAGAPIEVEATINGNVWRFVVESYGHDRAFGSRSYSITGRSLSAYLADPYSLPASLLQNSQLTAAQLADAALSGTGFTSNWQLTDWLVPGGVYSVTSQTPMQQLLTISAAAGGTVQSAMAATTISLMPWYATVPWEWGGATVSATLPSYKEKRTSYSAGHQYSGVYVSGQAQGVMCLVKRTGTDGSDQPQMITDSLITATEAGLQRGKRILADSGPRSVESIVAPLFDDPGLLKPGQLIDVVDGGTTWRGLVTSCRISAQRPTVTQSIDVLRYHGS